MTRPAAASIPALLAALVVAACSSNDSNPSGPLPPGACRTLSDYARVTAVIPGAAFARRAVAQGDLVYVADGPAGFSVLDADGVRSTLPGASAAAFDVALMDGGGVAVAWGSDGVVVVDTGDPDAPSVLGQVAAPGSAVDVFVAGSLVYVADDEVGLLIVDVSDPSRPTLLGVENTPGEASGVVAAGPLAYVADRQLGVRVANVTDPAAPFLLRSIPMPGITLAVALGDGYLYVADDLGGMHVVDVRTPGAETIVHTSGAGLSNRDVSVDGDALFVARGTDGVQIFDVSVPAQPQPTVRFGALDLTEGISAGQGIAVASDLGAGVRVIDATIAAPAPERDRDAPAGSEILAVGARDSLVVAADSTLGIRTWIAGSSGLTRHGTLALGGGAHRILIDGNRCFVARAHTAVEVVDIFDASRPLRIGSVPFSSEVTGMAVDGDALYLSRGSAALLEVDLSGQAPPRAASLNSRYANDVAVTGTHAYVPMVDGQLFVVSRSSFDRPVGGYPVAGVPTRVVMDRGDAGLGVPLETDYAFVAMRRGDRGPGVLVLNLFSPASPTELAFVATSGPAEALALAGGLMYVGLGAGGVEVFDVTHLDAIERLGFYPAQSRVSDVAASGALVFAADGVAGLFSAAPASCE